ncbi:hypothetical protein B0H16DRAFT_1453649 [Mycena metata]|uniref:Uncharacterized protein n=1 Tax=Mycena metata TaxID=1033252 RepID=A0AAD7NN83_9AGAR|nr:hypothetical protein B0H16DRAFT_1453649 [Mycena metata]
MLGKILRSEANGTRGHLSGLKDALALLRLLAASLAQTKIGRSLGVWIFPSHCEPLKQQALTDNCGIEEVLQKLECGLGVATFDLADKAFFSYTPCNDASLLTMSSRKRHYRNRRRTAQLSSSTREPVPGWVPHKLSHLQQRPANLVKGD